MLKYTDHLAVTANRNSVQQAQAKNREAWLGLYHDDAIICDPVGESMFDPEGKGHKGKAAITEFFDNVIAHAPVTIHIGDHRIGGKYDCAVPMRAVNDLGDGVIITVEMIAVYHVDEAGLIRSMHAYWDWPAMEQQLQAAMS